MTNEEIGSQSDDGAAPGLGEQAEPFAAAAVEKLERLVAIGASAGGLDALEVFFANMPITKGIAFVVSQHQSAEHESHLADILASKSAYPVKQITDRQEVQPGHVYVVPPGVQTRLQDSQFRIRPITPEERPPYTINHLLTSLSQEFGERAVAIILSGSGTDGAKGIVDVHGEGGAVLIQDAKSARFDGMPLSAAAMGCHDLIARADDMPDALLRLLSTGSPLRSKSIETDLAGDDGALAAVIKLLFSVDGVDFSEYKPGTIIRRIERRMIVNRFQSVDAYRKFLERNAEELKDLHADLLIGVTRFFRDPLSFQAVERRIMPELVKLMSAGRPLRVWVAGSSSGEEVYSLAMTIYEHMEMIEPQPEVKIFATDIHPGSLATASVALYNHDSLMDIGEGRLERHFVKDGDRYRVGPHLRQMIVFTRHNLLLDPPFTNIDFVSCRNMIMYFDNNAQEQAIARLHFSLRVGGYLFLGSAEQVSHFENEFLTLDRAARIYRKRREVKLVDVAPIGAIRSPNIRWPSKSSDATPERRAQDPMKATLDAMVEKLVEAAFIIDQDGQLLHTIGDVRQYLVIRPGPMRANIYDMIDHEFKTALLTAVLRAERTNERIDAGDIEIAHDEKALAINISVFPVRRLESGVFHFLVKIEQIDQRREDFSNLPSQIEFDAHYVRQLHEELELTRRSLREMTEEVGARNEELQAVNEEIMSSNAELQTTNEELQSVNEELHTVNSEYQRKINELEVITDDMSNLMASSEIGTIFADSDLRVRQFTDQVKTFFPLRQADLGRPLYELASRLGFLDIDHAIDAALNEGTPQDLEVQDPQGRWFQLRILPYRRQNKVIDGVVLTFVDINSIKQAELMAEYDRERFLTIVEDQTDLVCRFDRDFKLTFVNRAYCQYFSKSADELIGLEFLSLIPQEESDAIRKRIRAIPAGQAETYEHLVELPSGERRWQRWTDRAITDEAGVVTEYQSVGRDVTHLRQMTDQVAAQQDYLTDLLARAPICVLRLDPQDRIESVSTELASALGYSSEGMVGQAFTKFLSGDSQNVASTHLAEMKKVRRSDGVPYCLVGQDGTTRDFLLSAVSHFNADGKFDAMTVFFQPKNS